METKFIFPINNSNSDPSLRIIFKHYFHEYYKFLSLFSYRKSNEIKEIILK